MRAVDITGQTFHYLTAIKPVGSSKSGVVWECRCKCGKTTKTTAKSLRAGNTKSCGCLNSERVIARNKANATHGMTGTPTFISWDSMIQRCTNPNHKAFEYYGGAGITVCPAWLSEFSAFHKDMGDRPAGMTLDRINSAGNYEPGNCRWATDEEQGNNKKSNRVIEHDGRKQTIAQWAREVGMSRQTLRNRLEAGWSIQDALTLSVSHGNCWRVRGAK